MDETHTRPPLHSGDVADSDDLVSLPSGYPLTRYQLLDTLGQGTFGITYRAHDAQLNRSVAIKEYLPAALAVRHGGTQVLPRSTRVADDFRWGRDRFLAEAQTLAQFENTPAVVRVYDFLEANGTAYMVMELLRGETLEARLKRDGRLPPDAVEGLLHPLLDGLERVHATGILHRDIKPSNITLDAEGRPTLLDFGAARAAIAGRTTALTAVYTPGYAAAEQFTSATQGPYTDIYALAATLYQCVTGSMPPTALERLMDDRLVPASRAAEGRYPRALLAGIDAGLALKSQDRPPSIAAWRQLFSGSRPTAFAPAAIRATEPKAEGSATRISRHAAARPRQPAGARRWAIAGAVALLVIGGSVGGYLYVRDVEQRATAERERIEAERRAAEAAREKAAAEARQRELEAQRLAELERARVEEARRQAEEEAKRRAEEEAGRQGQFGRDAEERRQDEARRLAEEEARRKSDADARRRQDEEARRKAEADAEARRLQEEDAARRQGSEEARRKAEADAQARRLQEEDAARRQAVDEARRKAEADAQARRLQEEDAARRLAAEAARRKAEADARRHQQEEEARRLAAEEARRKAEAEARRTPEEEARRRAAEEARRKAEADARRQQDEEARRRAAEEARRKAEADARRKQEEAALRRPAGVDGTWTGTVECYPGGPKSGVSLQVATGQGRATVQGMKIVLRISESSVVSDLAWIGQEGREWEASLRGRPAGDSLSITGTARTIGGRQESFRPQCTLNLRRQ